MLNNMKMRKRGAGGHYDDDQSTSKIMELKMSNMSPPNGKINVKDIRQNNPNIERNFELLFPKKPEHTKKVKRERNINYMGNDERLKGMKSVMNEISNDIG